MALARACILLLVVLCVLGDDSPHDTLYDTPKPSGPVVFLETFNDDHWTKFWSPSTDPKYTGDWEVQESEYVRVSGDRGLVITGVAKHHGIGALFPKVLDTTDKDLVVQYEVQLQHGLECGGAYLKLVTEQPSLDIKQISSDVPYTIMFGPDKCGTDDKLHFIIRHENPISHVIEEKHLSPRPHIKMDKLTHLYTLHVRKDNSFEISIDQEVVKTGNLLQDLQPSITPPTEIDDATDNKPSDWVDDELIPDVEATKPDDWDESEPTHIEDPTDTKPAGWLDNEPDTVPDPNAKKPAEWNDEEDGEWIPAMVDNPKCEEHGCGEWKPIQIKNPKYKGKWIRPNIKNPLYKGVWAPRKVPNPHYFEDLHPSNFPKMSGIVFELWTMSDGILFDNILVTHDKSVADDFAERTWAVKFAEEKKKSDLEATAQLDDEENYLVLAQKYLAIAYRFAMDNPFILGAATIVGLIPLVVCCNISSAPKKPQSLREPGEQDDEQETNKDEITEEKGNDKEEEIQEEEKEKEKKSPTLKKRKIPRAD